jgi:hypothetical protein
MGVRRKRKSGFISKLRRLGFLALLGGAAFVAWQQVQRRRTSAPVVTAPPASPGTVPPQPAMSAPASDNGDDSRTGKIKGNAGSMLYHTVDSPNYKRTKAETWFDTEEEAQAAGFQRWDHKRGSRS